MKKILILVVSLALFSCEDYVDVNEDQSNNPYGDQLRPNNMMSAAIKNYTANQVVSLNSYGNEMAYVWALNTGYTSVAPYFSYNYSSSSYSGLFDNSMVNAGYFQKIMNREAQFPEYSYHYGVSRIFKVMCYDYLLALYGDVPYSQAFKSDITEPAYDDDATIYPKLFAELDAARNYFTNPDVNVIALGAEDIVFAGDITKWEEFANTIELRLLMRLSSTTNANLIALRTSRFATLNSNFIADDVAVNPGYGDDTVGQRTPVAISFGRTADDSDYLDGYKSNAAGEFASKLVQGQINTPEISSAGVVDPRRPRIFSGTTYTKQGVFPNAVVSRFSTFFQGRPYTASAANLPFNKDAQAVRSAYIFQLAESYFLQAEAVQRGFMTGSAEAFFDLGISSSFDFLNDFSWVGGVLPALNLAGYKTAISSKNGLGWAGSTDKINCIITQKYIALANWNGMELYLDHLRTGYPDLPLPVGVTQSNRPNRLIYSNNEYSTNSSNVPNVTLSDLFTVNSKTPVYLQ